jgi:hypothetical protein
MDAAILHTATSSSGMRQGGARSGLAGGRLIPAAEFRNLLVSHRRMVRVDRRADKLRGLQDLDTGEVFLTDEQRLLESQR